MKKVLIVVFTMICACASAQQAEQGMYPGITYDSDGIGNVNLTTGSVAINQSMFSLPQLKGMPSFAVSNDYNTPVYVAEDYYDPEGNVTGIQWMPGPDSSYTVGIPPFAGASVEGWWPGTLVWTVTTLTDVVGNPAAYDWNLITPDGNQHSLEPTASGYRSMDGSNYILNSTGTQLKDAAGTTYQITVPTGTMVPAANSWANENSAAYPMTITNIHGQAVSGFNTDSLGRTWSYQETNDYTGCTGTQPTLEAYAFYVTDTQGSQHNIAKLCMAAFYVQTNLGECHDDAGFDDCEYSTENYNVQSIVLPLNNQWNSGYAWTYAYGPTNNTASNFVNFGWLTQITTPTGGSVSYAWQPGTGYNGEGVVKSRTLNSGDGSPTELTTYAFTFLSATCPGVSGSCTLANVTNPDGTSVSHYASGPTLGEVATIHYDSSGSTTETVATTYQSASDLYNIYNGGYPSGFSLPTSQTVTWPNGVSCETTTTYTPAFSYSFTPGQTGNPHPPTYSSSASNGEVARSNTYDCSTGTGALLQYVQNAWMDQIDSNYAAANLINLLQNSTVYDGGGNQVSLLTNYYDQNGETGYPGDLTEKSVWSGTGTISASMYYDSTGNLIRSVDPSGLPTLIGYDPTGIVATSTTLPPVPSGVTLDASTTPDPFTYLPINTTNVSGGTSTQNYDQLLRPTTGTLANGASTSYTYDTTTEGSNTLPEVVYSVEVSDGSNPSYVAGTPTNAITKAIMDGFGRVLQTNVQTTSGTQSGWRQQDTCYDNMGRVSYRSYPYVTLSATPATHSCTGAGDTFSYEALGRLWKTTHQDGTFSSISYTGRATETIDEMGVSKLTQVDGLGRPTIVCEISSNATMPGSGSPASCGTDISGTGFVTTYAYNLATHTTTVTQGSQQRIFQADAIGRPLSVTEPESGATTYSYTYNSTGLQTVRTRPEANQQSSSAYTTTTTQTDSLGRVISIVYNDSIQQTGTASGSLGTPATATVTITGSEGGANDSDESCAVVADSGVISIRVGGFGYSVSYGPGSTVDSLAEALAGGFNENQSGQYKPVTVVASSGGVLTFTSTVDGGGSIHTIHSSVTPTTGASADFAVSPLIVDLTGGSYSAAPSGTGYLNPSKYFTYDTLPSPSWSMPLGDSNGQLVLATNGLATTQFGGYDALGDVGNTVQCMPGWCGQSAHDVLQWYQYDLRGLTTQMSYLTGGSQGQQINVNTGRGVDGSLTYISGGQGNTSASLDPNGNPILLQVSQAGAFGLIGGKLGNGIGLSLAYDSMGRLSGGWSCSGGVTSPGCVGTSTVHAFSNLGWTGGYLTNSTDTAQGQTNVYQYDQFGRLSFTNINNQSPLFSYQYDRYGNRWSQSATGSSAQSAPQPQLTFNTSNNHLTTATYDAAGNVLSDGLNTYLYDAEGNVVSANSTDQYVYDALNQRVETIGSRSGEQIRYAFNIDGQRQSTWSEGILVSANYYADGVPLAYFDPNHYPTTLLYEHSDWQGTVRTTSDGNGAVASTFTSLPFGDGASGTNLDPLEFAGLDYDGETETDHAQFRQLSTIQGRWLSPDPYGGSYDPENPQSFNRYAYVLNNPVSATDTSGLKGCEEAAPLGSFVTCYDGYEEEGGEQTGSLDAEAQATKQRNALVWLDKLLTAVSNLLNGPPVTSTPGADPANYPYGVGGLQNVGAVLMAQQQSNRQSDGSYKATPSQLADLRAKAKNKEHVYSPSDPATGPNAGQCVTACERFTGVPGPTSSWRAGKAATGLTDADVGTAIATFGPGGHYGGSPKNSGVFMGTSVGGIWFADQWPTLDGNKPVSIWFMPTNSANNPGNSAMSASYYRVITVP